MSLVQAPNAAGSAASATTITNTFGANVTAGNLIYVAISWDHAGTEGVTSITDGLGNTYTEINRRFDSVANQMILQAYAKNITGGACAVTCTFLGSRLHRRMVVREYAGLDTTAPLDQFTSNYQNAPGTGTDAVTSTAVTTTTNGQTIVASTMDDSGAANTVTAGTGFGNLVSGPGAIPPISSEDMTQSTAGSIAGTFTLGLDHSQVTLLATFKATTTTGIQTSRVSMMGCSGSATLSTPPPPSTGLGRYGGAPGSHMVTGLSTSEIQFEVDTWAADGCQVLRYDWLPLSTAYRANFATALDRCELNGIQTICCLGGTAGPVGATTAAARAHEAAVLFGDRISVWEWVNEPNLGSGSGLSRYTPAQYGPELAAVYAQLKADLPGCVVANGGMGIWLESGSSYPPNWWPLALAAGASGHFDLFNSHAYNDTSGSQWSAMMGLEHEGKPRIVTEAGSQGTASFITNALNDSRAECVCIYTMFSYESVAWAIRGTARETAYVAVTGA